MRSRGWLPVVFGLVLGGGWPGYLPAQTGANEAPLQARLEVPLETRRATVGMRVVASALAPWTSGDCRLQVGSTISGHVVAVQSLKESQRESRLAAVFDRANCGGGRDVPVSLLLIGVVRVEETDAERDAKNNPGMIRSEELTAMGAVGGGGRGYTGAGARGGARKGEDGKPAVVEAGQVIGVKTVTLGIGEGPDGASVLHSGSRDFSLDTRVTLILQPVERKRPGAAMERAAVEPAAVQPAAPPPAPPPPPDPTEVCAASDCNVADPGGAGAVMSGASRATSLLRFGYNPRSFSRREFDGETTVSYLSPGQVLVTFDPHRLRSRSPGVWPEVERRPIRAMLVSAGTGAVERVVDWTVEGNGPYLWPAGPGRVLVHTGGALEVLGPDLKPGLRIPIDANLQWVTSSPSGDAIAFAVLRERHTRETHAFIHDRTGIEPEEDIELREVDSHGAVHLTRSTTSRMRAPVLTDGGGEITMRHERGDRWLLREEAGATAQEARDNTQGGSRDNSPGGSRDDTHSDPQTIAVIHSSCDPRLTPLNGDAVFAVGCDDADRWYRVLRRSGHPVLLGRNSPLQIEQGATGESAGVYAVRVVRTRSPVANVQHEAKDLAEERVAVYRLADGKQLLLASTRSFPEAHQNFALSPDGRQVAVLTGSEVTFYVVGGGAGAGAGAGAGTR